MKKTLFAIGAAALALTALNANPAAAAIQCDGPYQISKYGSSFRSSYCEDAHIAYVASQRGRYVSADAIRHNPSLKAEVCRGIGHLPSVKLGCIGYGQEDTGFFRN
ncbi:MAG: hypothetical protein VX871_06585 [Pseudomonadota bacterium]|nr:hypothetical protein [Pseudomonadota bacterium]